MRFPTTAALLATLLLWGSGALAAEADDFQVLHRHTGLPESVHRHTGQSLTPKKAQGLWRGLVDSPANLRTFAPLGRDPATAVLLGAQYALEDIAKGLAAFITQPAHTLEGLAQLPSAVAGLIASSPEYFARYGAMNLEDQIREAARLATHVLTLQGGAATVGPRLASATRLPVLTLSAWGSLVVHELAVPAGAMTAVVAEGGEHVRRVPAFPVPGDGRSGGMGLPRPHGPGPKDYVDFDGFKNGVLLEVKGPGYRELLRKMNGKPWFEGVEEMLDQGQETGQSSRKHAHPMAFR